MLDILNLGHDTDWMNDGACVDANPELFFADGKHPGSASRQAVKICATCPVQGRCLKFALDSEEWFGVWGGMTETRRRREILKRRNAGAVCRQTGCIQPREWVGDRLRAFCVDHKHHTEVAS